MGPAQPSTAGPTRTSAGPTIGPDIDRGLGSAVAPTLASASVSNNQV